MNMILDQINAAGHAFVEFAVPMLVQSSLLILILLFADLLLRKKVTAGFRYWIWTLVLVKLALPASLSTPVSVGHWLGEELAVMDVGQMTVAHDAVESDAARYVPSSIPTRPSAESSLPVSEPVISPVVSGARITWQGIVFSFWLVVVMVMALLLLQRTLYVRGLVAQAQEASDSMNDTLAHCCDAAGIRCKVKLRISTNTAGPAVCRLFRPVILLPQNLLPSLDTSQLRVVLMHELAHLKRFDLWVNLVQTFLQIVYFYNPLLWLANAIIRRAREQAVDEAVLVVMGEKAHEYLDTLVNVAKLAFKGPTLSLRLIGVVESKSLFEWRIRTMLSRPIPKSARLGVVGVGALLVSAAVLLPMAKAEKSGEQGGPATGEDQARSASPLHKAAAEGDVEQVESLISKGADVNARNENGWTPLHSAAYYGQKEVAQILITKGANVGATNASGRTPLHLAAEFGSKHMLELLIAAGANVNARDNRGVTPMHAAEEGAMTQEFLLARGADVNARNDKGETPLHLVCKITKQNAKIPSTVAVLLANGAEVNAKDNSGGTPLHVAAASGQRKVVELLLAKGADIKEKAVVSTTALHLATMRRRYDIVEFLLDRGADINSAQSDGRTALHLAAERGHDAVAALLIARGADVNAESRDGETPLDVAALAGETKICTILIAKGAKVNSLCSSVAMGDLAEVQNSIKKTTDINVKNLALRVAAACGQEDIVKLLLSRGAQVSATRKDGEMPLHLAARGGYENLVRLVLESGANVNARDHSGYTPLHCAAEKGHEDVAALLIAKGADVHAEDRGRWRPFDYAAGRDYKDIVQLLLDKGASLDVNGRYDWTPLMSAAWSGHKDLAELLVQRGADVNERMPGGWSPVLSAAHRGHTDILALLLAHGAEANVEDRWGWSALHYATGPDITKLLLGKGADPNVVEREGGGTPLHFAAGGGKEGKDYKTMAELLIRHGADVNARDWEGNTPLYWAQEEDNTDIVALLKKHGAKE
ncbi:MAG: ankyrin repeat domain-containing protein [Planctomycetota bacterium]|jgi:ankyrin repeat protein/Zn-dependent protease with chaperone function